jgi:cytochrome c peroxidase
LLSAVLIGALLLPGGAVFAAAGDPLPLSTVAVPEPPNLATYVKDKAAAIKLGKALFWDTQAGSDGVTACASCHYRAGADPIGIRSKNQLAPGTSASGISLFQSLGPNATLTGADFPFFQVNPVDAAIGTGTVINDTFDIAGSQGVRKNIFTGITIGNPVDSGTTNYGLPFNNHRQVTGRNTPPAVNAVFNYANFWDGRANNIFNGASPIGPLDVNAGIWVNNLGVLSKQTISIPNASLASQAVGPPLNNVEMSYDGRTFPELGRKLLSLTPLGQQTVHPADSVLGPLSRAALNPDGTLSGSKGLNATYKQMINDAFVSSLTSTTLTTNIVTRGAPVAFTQMEANFSLFWGLAIQLYEATLVSDQTPFDQYLDDLSKGVISTAMSVSAQNGFNIFNSQCAKCHSGSELTAASVSNAEAAIASSTHSLITKGATSLSNGVSDIGFSNIGVRPTADDIGRGATQPNFPFPLSFAAQAVSKATDSTSIPFETFPLPNNEVAPVVVDGAFKIPSIRNVELTPPYMHNGSMFTLEEVAEFYARGGNFANPEMDKEMLSPIGTLGGADKRAAVVEFLKALTDPRVALESAPFDHPELLLPQGDPELPMTRLPATGSNGETDVLSAFTINVTSPTNQTSQTIGGTLEKVGADAMAAPTFTVSSSAVVGPVTVIGNTWTANVTGLVQGDNIISATATDLAGVTKTIAKTILAGITAPVGMIVINNDDAVTNSPFVTLSLSAAGPSTITSMRFSTDGLSFFPSETFAKTKPMSFSSGDGPKIIYVRFRDSAGRDSEVYTDTIVLDSTVQPVLTINVTTPTNVNYQIVSGTVEAGSTVKVTVDTPARVGPVTVTGTSWSALISGLREGPNTVTVQATDSKGVVSTASAIIIVDTMPPFVNIDTAIGACIRGNGIGIAGTAEIGSKIKVICDHAKADVIFFDDAFINKTRWTAQLLGFVEGLNHCEVIAIDAAGNKAVEKADFDHDNIKPVIHVDANVKKAAKFGAPEAITGTVEAGITPTMTLNGAAYSAPVTANGSAWSCTVDDLKLGDNIIRVEARDLCENVHFEDFHIFVIKADGELDGHVGVTVADALKALRFSVGLDIPKIEDEFHADFLGDHFIDLGDAIFILRKAVDENLSFEELIAEILAVQP